MRKDINVQGFTNVKMLAAFATELFKRGRKRITKSELVHEALLRATADIPREQWPASTEDAINVLNALGVSKMTIGGRGSRALIKSMNLEKNEEALKDV
jgi:hypothetical protein